MRLRYVLVEEMEHAIYVTDIYNKDGFVFGYPNNDETLGLMKIPVDKIVAYVYDENKKHREDLELVKSIPKDGMPFDEFRRKVNYFDHLKSEGIINIENKMVFDSSKCIFCGL